MVVACLCCCSRGLCSSRLMLTSQGASAHDGVTVAGSARPCTAGGGEGGFLRGEAQVALA